MDPFGKKGKHWPAGFQTYQGLFRTRFRVETTRNQACQATIPDSSMDRQRHVTTLWLQAPSSDVLQPTRKHMGSATLCWGGWPTQERVGPWPLRSVGPEPYRKAKVNHREHSALCWGGPSVPMRSSSEEQVSGRHARGSSLVLPSEAKQPPGKKD